MTRLTALYMENYPRNIQIFRSWKNRLLLNSRRTLNFFITPEGLSETNIACEIAKALQESRRASSFILRPWNALARFNQVPTIVFKGGFKNDRAQLKSKRARENKPFTNISTFTICFWKKLVPTHYGTIFIGKIDMSIFF